MLRRGAVVVHSGISDVHATGHAQSEDLKIYLSIANPRWFVPIHGEYIHMHANRNLGILMGVPPNRALLCADGDVLRLKEGTLSKESTISRCKSVSAKYVFVDQTRNQKSSKQNNNTAKR